MRTQRHVTFTFIGILAFITSILAVDPALSNSMLLADGSRTIPYEDGGTETIPSAAARISDLSCTSTYDGRIYNLEIEVFETSWKPIYTIEFEGIEGTSIEAIACPSGWTADQIGPKHGLLSRAIFSTKTEPIAAGSRLRGFRLATSGPKTILRWYPADEAGLLVGKVTREELSCPTGREPRLWGAIKALYR